VGSSSQPTARPGRAAQSPGCLTREGGGDKRATAGQSEERLRTPCYIAQPSRPKPPASSQEEEGLGQNKPTPCTAQWQEKPVASAQSTPAPNPGKSPSR